uniref:Putative transporter n=1 Tax=Corethrella appendiculata TaxID=1370023 RepID=U5EUS0_9DIPT
MTNIRPLTLELAEKAKNELNEVPSRIESDLTIFKEWIKKQPHLNARMDDQFLLAFLRGCKFSIERAKEKLDNFYTVRSCIPEFFHNRNPNNLELQEVMKLGVNLPLVTPLENDLSKIIFVRMGRHLPEKYQLTDVMKVCYMITDILLVECDNTIISGHHVVVDAQDIKFSILSQVSSSLVKKMTSTIENYPIRTRGMHFINLSTTFEAVFKLFYGFLSEKIKQRVFVYNSFEELHQRIPKKYLPDIYDGDAGSLEDLELYWRKKMIDYQQFFSEDSKYGTNEKKRVGIPKTASSLFGVDGTFRSLEVD